MQPDQLTEGIFQIEMHVENRKVLNYLYLLAYIIDTHGSRTLARQDMGQRTLAIAQRQCCQIATHRMCSAPIDRPLGPVAGLAD